MHGKEVAYEIQTITLTREGNKLEPPLSNASGPLSGRQAF